MFLCYAIGIVLMNENYPVERRSKFVTGTKVSAAYMSDEETDSSTQMVQQITESSYHTCQ